MTAKAKLSAAMLAAFNLDADGARPEAVADTAAEVLCAFAAAVRGPALAGAMENTAPSDITLELILTEMRQQTALLAALASSIQITPGNARRKRPDESGLPG